MKTDIPGFSHLTQDSLQRIKNKYNSPIFIFDEQGLVNRFKAIKNAALAHYKYSIVAISYKTNFLKGLLYRLHQEGAHAEVVSGLEYEVANTIKQKDQIIVFNGPYKTDEELRNAILGDSIINCDHEEEIDRISEIATKLDIVVPIGLRLYFSEFSWSRFGIPIENTECDENFIALVTKIQRSKHIRLAGLHAHIGTNIRDIVQFEKLAVCLYKLAMQLKKFFDIELSWIDVGGGLAGISPCRHETEIDAYPLPNINLYMNAIIKPLLPYLTTLKEPAKLIFESGRTLFEAFGALLTQVVGVKPSENNQALILDAGFNVLSTSHVYNFPIHYFSKEKEKCLTSLFGPTCNQVDELHNPVLLPRAKRNDLILFYGVGSYCFSFGYSFIRFKPAVVLLRNDGTFTLLRKEETLSDNSITGIIPAELKV